MTSAPLLFSQEASPGVSSSRVLSTGRTLTCRDSPEQGHRDGHRDGSLLLRQLGIAQPGHEKTPGQPYRTFHTCRKAGEGLLTRSCGDWTTGNGFKFKERKD